MAGSMVTGSMAEFRQARCWRGRWEFFRLDSQSTEGCLRHWMWLEHLWDHLYSTMLLLTRSHILLPTRPQFLIVPFSLGVFSFKPPQSPKLEAEAFWVSSYLCLTPNLPFCWCTKFMGKSRPICQQNIKLYTMCVQHVCSFLNWTA